MGFRVAAREALDQLAAKFGSDVVECPHPGGGLYVVGSDPDGRRLEFVFGATRSRLFLQTTPRSGGTTRMRRTGWASSSARATVRRTSSASAMSPCSRRLPSR